MAQAKFLCHIYVPMTHFAMRITTGMVTNKMPIRSIMMPDLIILVIGTYPEAYTMALGGVDTGIINPSDAASATPIATGIGLNPTETAVLMAMGPIRLVDAV